MEISNKKDLLAMSKLLNVFLAVGFLTASLTSVGLGGALAYLSLKREPNISAANAVSRVFGV